MALAIAQGVASGADLGDGKGKTMTVDRTKTTMPQAVTALVEEALVRILFISTSFLQSIAINVSSNKCCFDIH